MKRDIRYYVARSWAVRGAKAMPGVVCTVAIDNERLSCTTDEDGRTHWHTWQVFEEGRK